MQRIEKHLTRIGLATLFLVATTVVALRLTGTQTYTVMSGSMVPAIPLGSLVIARPSDPATVQVGDVLTYQLPDRLVTHRVVAVEAGANGRSFTTKGDANPIEDPDKLRFLKAVGMVQGTVPGLGYAVVYAQAYWRLAALGFAAIVFLVAGALLVFGQDTATTPQPLRVARAHTKRAARRIASVQDELWVGHLSWLRKRQELAA